MQPLIKTFCLWLILSLAALNAQQPYIILISFDGFRWDYVDRGITPNFDFIKENDVSALSLRPCFPSKTFPNHYSIITGMYPEHHGIISNNFNDYHTGRDFAIRDTIEARDARWYKGEAFWETAQRQGIKSASYFWVGSDMNIPYRRPEIFHYYDHSFPYKARIDSVIGWMNLSYDARPHFITAYFSATDDAGHTFGPNSPEVNLAIAQLDSLLGYLFQKLTEINMYDSTNIIVVSDHGMTEVSTERVVNIEQILEEMNYQYGDNGPFMLNEPAEGELENIYNRLKENENHYKVYRREEVPEHFHYSDNPLISKLVIMAENGWSVETNKSLEKMKEYGTKGNHGYDNYWMDMHGIFYAVGPAFKENYRTGTVDNINIYPLLCKIFNILPNHSIDGKPERICYILK
jgi:predicted AlkP superfamily pyrophosphatase or phosphodiesterase